jgi:flagellar M-ring protein FliF
VLLDDAHAQPAAAPNGQASAPPTVKPRSAEDIQKIQALVAAAVGFDTERGDQLTVENITFEETPIEELVAPPGAWQKYGPQVFEALRIFGVIALGFFALFGVVRPLMKAATTGGGGVMMPVRGTAANKALAAVAAGAPPRTVQDLEAEMDAQLMSGEALKMPVLTRRMAALSQKEPENAARLLRTWLNEE